MASPAKASATEFIELVERIQRAAHEASGRRDLTPAEILDLARAASELAAVRPFVERERFGNSVHDVTAREASPRT